MRWRGGGWMMEVGACITITITITISIPPPIPIAVTITIPLLYSTLLYSTLLYYTILYYNILYCTVTIAISYYWYYYYCYIIGGRGLGWGCEGRRWCRAGLGGDGNPRPHFQHGSLTQGNYQQSNFGPLKRIQHCAPFEGTASYTDPTSYQ